MSKDIDDDPPIAAFLVLIALPLAVIVRGFVISILWSWFVAAPFDVPAIDKAEAIGLALLIGTFVPSAPNKKKPGETLIDLLIVPWLILLFGYLVHLCV